jgi:hypothetical protein
MGETIALIPRYVFMTCAGTILPYYYYYYYYHHHHHHH